MLAPFSLLFSELSAVGISKVNHRLLESRNYMVSPCGHKNRFEGTNLVLAFPV
jgi:hypothetical protein